MAVTDIISDAISNNIRSSDAPKNYSVYIGRDEATGKVLYVGMTGREPEIRWLEHLKSRTDRANLVFETIGNNLTKTEARILEQNTINKYGLQNLLNKINSIAPKFWDIFNIKP